jgi:hypothetical protein
MFSACFRHANDEVAANGVGKRRYVRQKLPVLLV